MTGSGTGPTPGPDPQRSGSRSRLIFEPPVQLVRSADELAVHEHLGQAPAAGNGTQRLVESQYMLINPQLSGNSGSHPVGVPLVPQ